MLGLDFYLNESPYAANLDPERLGAAGASYGGQMRAKERVCVLHLASWSVIHLLTPCAAGLSLEPPPRRLHD